MKEEKVHWFLVIHTTGLIDGQSSDGRFFEEPTRDPLEWVRGFRTHCNMSGQTVEVRKA